MDISMQNDNKNAVLSLIRSQRIPHTVIIEGGSQSERESAAMLLAAGAVCRAAERPCMCCAACHKTLSGIHPDVFIPEPSKNLKSGILSLKDLRDSYMPQMTIKPNEANVKVFIFNEADRLLREDSQNALLKTIEEPPQNLLFIFTAESSKSLLLTVRSRARIITLRQNEGTDEECEARANALADGIAASYEYDLLLALSGISDKEQLRGCLTAFTEKLRLALCFHSGVNTRDEAAKKLARKLDRERALRMINVTSEALSKLNTNVNLQLLTTWLSSQYRRITWQK